MRRVTYHNLMESKKPYHHGDLREQLLLAGEQALAEMPIDTVSLREISRRAGVSHAAPKHHFASMADLLGEIAARGFEKFVVALGTAAQHSKSQTAEDRLFAMGRAYLRFADDNSAVYSLMFGQVIKMSMTPALTKSSYEAWSQLENAVAQVTGPLRAPISATHVWSSVHGLSMLKSTRRLPPHVSLHAVEEENLRMMIAGIKEA
jgi:AcrR family transcriptional regulator